MDLIIILQQMGALIKVGSKRKIVIKGVAKLVGFNHHALFDRNETVSWACAALATKGDIFIEGARREGLDSFLHTYEKVGGAFDVHIDGIRFYHPGGPIRAAVVQTDVHPGFMTDWQQPLLVVLTKAKGVSIIHETVYEDRFQFTEELKAMGANIIVHKGDHKSVRRGTGLSRPLKQSASIIGPVELSGTDICVKDLRGGFAVLVAALAASGPSIIRNAEIIDRGYEHLVEKLRSLGADIR